MDLPEWAAGLAWSWHPARAPRDPVKKAGSQLREMPHGEERWHSCMQVDGISIIGSTHT